MRNGVDLSGQTGQGLTFNDSGNFSVKVSDNGCLNTSDPIRIDKLPSPVTSAIQGKSIVVKGNRENYSVSGDSGSTFSWSVAGGSLASGAGTKSVQVDWGSGTNGTLQVQETAINGCKGIPVTLSVSLTNVGVNELDVFRNLVVYPNPSKGIISLQYEMIRQSRVQVKLMNLPGQELVRQVFDAQSGKISHSLDFSRFDAGVYFLVIQSDESSVVQKIIIE
jgi:hypothetical protein